MNLLFNILNYLNKIRFYFAIAFTLLAVSLSYYYKFRTSEKTKPVEAYQITEPSTELLPGVKQTVVAEIADSGNSAEPKKILASNFSPSYNNIYTIGNNTNRILSVKKDGSNEFIEIAKKVDKAQFIDDTNIAYITRENNPGIYQYDLSNRENKLILSTSDLDSFENVVFIDKNTYFFLQPTTGSFGLSEQGKQPVIIDSKKLDVKSNYLEKGAFRGISLSADKKYIAFLDIDSEKPFTARLLLYPSTARSKQDLYASIEVKYTPGPANAEKLISWSEDSKLLVAGSAGEVIHVEQKKIIYSPDNSLNRTTKISPDSKSMVSLQFPEGSFVQNLENGKQIYLPKDISDAEWVNNETIFLIIGKRAYLFDVLKESLYLALQERAEYKIVSINTRKSTVYLLQDNSLISIIK